MLDSKLLEALESGACVVTYKKIEGPKTGELREMECTLSPELIPTHNKIHQNTMSEHLLVWCIDRNDWRSVRADTIKEWKQKDEET